MFMSHSDIQDKNRELRSYAEIITATDTGIKKDPPYGHSCS